MKKKVRPFKLSIGVYVATLIVFVIVVVTVLFALFATFNIKALVGNFEIETKRLGGAVSTILVQAVKKDIETKTDDFVLSKKILEVYKGYDLLSYFYLQDNTAKVIVLGDETEREKEETSNMVSVRKQSFDIEEYTVHFGVPIYQTEGNYFGSFLQSMLGILLIFTLVSMVAGVYLSEIISSPLKNLSIAAKEIKDGNFNVRIKDSNFAEISDLISSYNGMGGQLDELYSSLEQKVKDRTIALEEANHKLQETQAMMVHSEKMRSLGELVAGIAHEINNPVNFIHGNIMILQNYASDLLRLIDTYDEKSTLSEEQRKEIENIKKEIDLEFLRDDIKDLIRSCIEGTQRTKNIVLDLKNFSRMEEMVLTQFDIPKEIDTTLNILNNKYKNRIEVVKNYDPEMPKIEAYGGQLNQVFMNILDNAQDAMGERGTLTINTYKIDENVKIEFIDTGAGIPEENLKKVFDPFFTTKTVGKGTGLGMSISYRVINDHKGKIEVESEVGKGTKFTITLPISHENISEEEELETV